MNDQFPGRVQHKSFRQPDELRPFPRGTGIGAVVRLASVDIGRAVLEPGWRWSIDIKPAVGTELCQLRHLHVVLSGRFAVQLDGRSVEEFGVDDVIDLPPGHDAWVVGDEQVVLLDISGNSADFGLATSATRTVATILMSDIVDSTTIAGRLGDAAWKSRLADHDRIVRRQIDRFRGHEIKTTGDGFLVIFDSAGAALRCGVGVLSDMRELGLELRIGVHTGEVELLAGDVRGIAVHATARIMAAAHASEILTSAVTRTLAEGHDLRFEARGPHELKGFDRTLELFAVGPETSPNSGSSVGR